MGEIVDMPTDTVVVTPTARGRPRSLLVLPAPAGGGGCIMDDGAGGPVKIVQARQLVPRRRLCLCVCAFIDV